MKALLAVAVVALIAGCAAQTQCVQPDPVQPASKTWNKGINGGETFRIFGAEKAAK